MKIPKG